MARNRIAKLQQQAAACTDELLAISLDISEHVLPLYNARDMELFDLQCRLMLSRCKVLAEKLELLRTQLQEEADACTDPDPVSQQRRSSAQVTLQIIAQNLAIAESKRLLLKDLQTASVQTEEGLKAAQRLRETAEIVELKNALGKELERCRNADEK